MSTKTFDSVCERHNVNPLDMLKFIKNRNITEEVQLCEMVSRHYHTEMTLKDATYIMEHEGEYCNSCGEPFGKKDIDGGRCLSCMSMIV
jgi:predicted Zn-ribbon and HTH transcriptional regulator